ncbi:MAG: molybdopterin converting factor subunit 1 [Hyphomicrobiales bacterium]|nr:molybdopterin converting factor subunit 1 [Hyphomicrobiales bacterium]
MAGPQTVTLRYFAWVRERIGLSEERIELPAGIVTIADLMTWLGSRGPEYAHAFERADIIRAAVDHVHVAHAATVAGAREIAFFPPVTGG